MPHEANIDAQKMMRSSSVKMESLTNCAPIVTRGGMARALRPAFDAMTARPMEPSATSVDGKTTSPAFVAAKAQATEPNSPPQPASTTEKQKVQFLTHFAPQPASVGQAKESSHLTITSTATSLTTGFDSHPSLNHSLRLQHQPIPKTIQPWDTTPPNHG